MGKNADNLTWQPEQQKDDSGQKTGEVVRNDKSSVCS